MSRPKVLYIEDKPDWQNVVKQGLRMSFQIEIAADEKSAKEQLEQERFELILLDLILDSHHSEGLNFWEYIKEHFPHTPVIIVTALEEEKIKDTLRETDPPYLLKGSFDVDSWTAFFKDTIEKRSTKLFISHSSEDKPFAYFIKRLLEEKGIRVWLDKEELVAGGLFIDDISDALFKMDYVLVILSPEAVASKNVRYESTTAVSLENDGKLKRVIPLVYKPCKIPKHLYPKNRIMFNEWLEDFDRQLGL